MLVVLPFEFEQATKRIRNMQMMIRDNTFFMLFPPDKNRIGLCFRPCFNVDKPNKTIKNTHNRSCASKNTQLTIVAKQITVLQYAQLHIIEDSNRA